MTLSAQSTSPNATVRFIANGYKSEEHWIDPQITGKTEGYPTYVAIKVYIYP
jgi:hypothetical protein